MNEETKDAPPLYERNVFEQIERFYERYGFDWKRRAQQRLDEEQQRMRIWVTNTSDPDQSERYK